MNRRTPTIRNQRLPRLLAAFCKCMRVSAILDLGQRSANMCELPSVGRSAVNQTICWQFAGMCTLRDNTIHEVALSS